MDGFPPGTWIEVPDGWDGTAFFEPIVQPGLCSFENLTGTVRLTDATYAARVSPAEVFGMFRVLDFRRYCGLVMDEMRRTTAGEPAVAKGQ